MKHISTFDDFINENLVLENIDELNEDLHSSKVLGEVIYNNAKKTSKLGGKVAMSIKSNRTTTANITSSYYYDPDSKTVPGVSFFDKETYPHLEMVYFEATYNNNKNTWKVKADDRFPKTLKELGLEDLKSGTYTDEEFADILKKYFDAVK